MCCILFKMYLIRATTFAGNSCVLNPHKELQLLKNSYLLEQRDLFCGGRKKLVNHQRAFV